MKPKKINAQPNQEKLQRYLTHYLSGRPMVENKVLLSVEIEKQGDIECIDTLTNTLSELDIFDGLDSEDITIR